MNEDILSIIDPIIKCLADLNIQYQIGGSIASSSYGTPRTTMDVDIAAEIKNKHISYLIKTLDKKYFIQESTIVDAIKIQSSFNIIHFETSFKIDIFILKTRHFDKEAITRKRKMLLDEERGVDFYICSPKDTILYKLEWYRIGGHLRKAMERRMWCSQSAKGQARQKVLSEMGKRT